MPADIYDLSGAPLPPEEVVPNEKEAMARMFEDMAEEARTGFIENFVVVLMRSPRHYAVRRWHEDTLRIIGALEAAKVDIIAGDAEVVEELNGCG